MQNMLEGSRPNANNPLLSDVRANQDLDLYFYGTTSINNSPAIQTEPARLYSNLINSIQKFIIQNTKYYKSAEEFINASGLSAFILTMIRTNPGAIDKSQQKYMFVAGMVAAYIFYINESTLQLAQHYKKKNSASDIESQTNKNHHLLQSWDLFSQCSIMVLSIGKKGAFILEYLAQIMGGILGLLNNYKPDSMRNDIYYSILGGFALIGVVSASVALMTRSPEELKKATDKISKLLLQNSVIKALFPTAKKLKIDTLMRLMSHAATYHTLANAIILIADSNLSLETFIKAESMVLGGATAIALPVTYFDDRYLVKATNRGVSFLAFATILTRLILNLQDDDVLDEKEMLTFFLLISATTSLGPLVFPFLAKCIESLMSIVKQIQAQLSERETNLDILIESPARDSISGADLSENSTSEDEKEDSTSNVYSGKSSTGGDEKSTPPADTQQIKELQVFVPNSNNKRLSTYTPRLFCNVSEISSESGSIQRAIPLTISKNV